MLYAMLHVCFAVEWYGEESLRDKCANVWDSNVMLCCMLWNICLNLLYVCNIDSVSVQIMIPWG